MAVLCFLIPFPILVFRRTLSGLTVSSICIIIGMWLERYTIIIPSFSEPRLPYARGAYTPSWVEWSLTAGLCAGFTLAFVLFSKLFPVISIWETEKEEKEKDGRPGGEEKIIEGENPQRNGLILLDPLLSKVGNISPPLVSCDM
jgi:Ni/Fe-hydrogenase subunit HybB-like protein